MTEREALVEAIAAGPDNDDLPRLVFADWLEENGEPTRAEFIRLQCQLARLPPDTPRLRNNRFPQEERASWLIKKHWPLWTRPLFRALGMPEPGPGGKPYRRKDRWGVSIDGTSWTLRVEYEDGYRSPNPTFVKYITFDRGVITALEVNVPLHPLGCSLATAFRSEPITELFVSLDRNVETWRSLTDPCLRHVRELSVDISATADHSAAIAAVLDDPNFISVARLTLEPGLDPHNLFEGSPSPARVSFEDIAAVVRSTAFRRVRYFRMGVGPERVCGLLGAPSALRLRGLEIATVLYEDDIRSLPAIPFRNQLEELWLRAYVPDCDCSALFSGPVWPRLTTLNLEGLFHTSSPLSDGPELFGPLARATAFPVIERLILRSTDLGDDQAKILSGAPFLKQLTHLCLEYCALEDAGALAIASAVNPAIQSLDMGYSNISAPVKEQIRSRFGDRVRLV
jgi:uncharacterized protein (TIGR02996 family)